jgi:hypothetical protein
MSLILISFISLRKNLAAARFKALILQMSYPQNNLPPSSHRAMHFCTHCVDKIVSKAVGSLSSI